MSRAAKSRPVMPRPVMPRPVMSRRSAATWMTTVLVLAACKGAPVTPEQRRLEERRLLAPFLAAVEVGCEELEIEITGNFHANVGQPGFVPEWHQKSRQKGHGYAETVWTNVAGVERHELVLTIGDPGVLNDKGLTPGPRTTFTVVNRVRLRIYEDSRPLMLDVRASGRVVMVKEAAASFREVKEYAVSDGVLRTP